jgi:hypothetical protein
MNVLPPYPGFTLKKAAYSAEALAGFYHTTRRDISEGCNVHKPERLFAC